MNKHLRAEWFRLVHSGRYFPLFLFISVLMPGVPFLTNPDFAEKNFLENLVSFTETLPMLIGAVTCTMIAVLLGNLYSNRTAYYEIMDGAGPAKIIFGKLLVYCPFALLLTALQFGIFFTCIGIKNGKGEMESPALCALLAAIVLLHLFSATVMMSLLAQHMLGTAIPYARFLILEQLVALFLLEANPDKTESIHKILDWLPSVQLQRLAQPSYSTLFILQVIASFVIEFAILYAITYTVYRKKRIR